MYIYTYTIICKNSLCYAILMREDAFCEIDGK